MIMFIAKWMEKSKTDCVIPPIPKILKFYPQNNLKITALQPERKSISKSYPKFHNKFAQNLKLKSKNSAKPIIISHSNFYRK